ncbi:MAG TPA: hypothetical protein VLV84_03155 [Candidatus Acidoferrales bacterium]|nr:hypothetical protein [Candidatus Acidoferrales bacterium]
METTAETIQEQMKTYASHFLKAEYGNLALKKLNAVDLIAVDAYDTGGVSEATEKYVKIAVKRDINAGKLTNTTKLIIRHELGHILDESLQAFPEFDEGIQNEKNAWAIAKPKTPAENWYRNISIKTHIDPLKMQSLGFPRPETKVSPQQLKQGTNWEIERMKKYSVYVDRFLAERFALANLIEDPDYYRLKRNT